MKLLLLLALFTQVPDVQLTVPDSPIAYARFVRMSVQPPVKGTAPNDWESFSVQWDVTERSAANNPLENDLVIDSNQLSGFVPAGLNPTSLKVRVAVTFVYKDYSTRVAQATRFVTIGPGTDVVVPPPGPITPVPGPVNPGPVNPGPVNPGPVIPTTEKYGLITWASNLANTNMLLKDECLSIAEGFHQIAGMARNGAMADRAAVVNAMTERLTNIQVTNRQGWINAFFEPLRIKLNPMGPRIKTVVDQAAVFDEVAYGLEKYAGGK